MRFRKMAEQEAAVSAIDASPAMLTEAHSKMAAHHLEAYAALEHLDVTQIGDHFPPASFDLIVSTPVFSEPQIVNNITCKSDTQH